MGGLLECESSGIITWAEMPAYDKPTTTDIASKKLKTEEADLVDCFIKLGRRISQSDWWRWTREALQRNSQDESSTLRRVGRDRRLRRLVDRG